MKIPVLISLSPLSAQRSIYSEFQGIGTRLPRKHTTLFQRQSDVHNGLPKITTSSLV